MSGEKVQTVPMQNKGIPTKPIWPSAITQIQNNYHYAMEQGRFAEQCVGDAQKEVQKFKLDLENRMKEQLQLLSGWTTCQLPDKIRPFKLVKDINDAMKAIKDIMQQIQTAIQTLVQIISMLKSLILKMLGQIQAIMNGVAALMNEICNWNLPRVPSLPNIFGDLTWGFNGFQLYNLLKLDTKLTFDSNFAFKQCHIRPPDTNIFRDFPRSVTGTGGIVYGNQVWNPPLGGLLSSGKESVITLSQPSNRPILNSTFDQTQDMNRSLPSVVTVLNNFSLPSANSVSGGNVGVANDYISNIVSVLPQMDSAISQSDLHPLYIQNINLEGVVNSDFDLNIASAWILYLNSCLNDPQVGRLGTWIPEFYNLFQEVISPSVSYLKETPIPYNFFNPNTVTYPNMTSGLNAGDTVTTISGKPTFTTSYVTGIVTAITPTSLGNSNVDVQIQQANIGPSDLPFINYVKGSQNQQNLLWRLSWLEAGLLGYKRSVKWDNYADNSYLSPITGSDLDYKENILSPTSVPVVLSSGGKAEYPTTVNIPSSIYDLVQTVIAVSESNIENNPTWSSNTRYRYIYDQFAQQHEIDRFSQFWREWASNFSALLNAGLVTNYACSYWQMIDSAVDPLGDPSFYTALKYDVENRRANWVPGLGLPQIPSSYSQGGLPDFDPNTTPSGWSNGSFSPSTFVNRPDIKGLPIPTQMAMVDLNKCYAALMQQQQSVQDIVNSQIISAQNSLNSALSAIGFQVESSVSETVGVTPSAYTFDSVAFDVGVNNQPGWVNGGSFTVPISGHYSFIGGFDFDTTPTVETVNLTKNGTSIFSISNTQSDKQIGLTFESDLSVGDQLGVSLSSTGPTTLLANSSFSVLASSPSATGSQGEDATLTYPIGSSTLTSLVAVVITGGELFPVDPNNLQTYTSWLDGVSLSGGNQGDAITIASLYGGLYDVPGASLIPDELMYVGANGIITQDFSSVIQGTTLVVGHAISPTSFVYQPHLPIAPMLSGRFVTKFGDGTNTSYTIAHNLNSLNLIINLWQQQTDGSWVEAQALIETVDTNTILVSLSDPPLTSSLAIVIHS